MGVELTQQYGELEEMEDVNFTDKELVYHVRDTLKSVQLVSKIYVTFFFGFFGMRFFAVFSVKLVSTMIFFDFWFYFSMYFMLCS